MKTGPRRSDFDDGHLHPRRMDHQVLYQRVASLPDVDGPQHYDSLIRFDHFPLLLWMLGNCQRESFYSVPGAYRLIYISIVSLALGQVAPLARSHGTERACRRVKMTESMFGFVQQWANNFG